MNRKKKLTLNTVISIAQRLVAVICGFILPRLFLRHFGSDVNGLVSSIGQFLTLITIFDSGMGVVIEASLYKPLAERNKKLISQIMHSGQKFYNRLVVILFVYVLGVALIYPNFVSDQFDYLYTLFLVLAISLSSFGQYCLGVTNGVLLSADQKGYVVYASIIVTTVLNTIISAVLIELNCSVQIVKLASSFVFLCRPVFLALYVKKHYQINWKEPYDSEPIKQKWNGLAQHIAAIVLGDTDVIVLTFFASLKTVSIYSVYLLVINSVKNILVSATAGIRSYMGNMIAKNEQETLSKTFSYIEWAFHAAVTLCFSLVAVLIVPFVKVYTSGINDANYIVPSFALILSIAYCIYCYRIPYLDIIMASGKFKEIQGSAILEALLNLVISILAVFKFGLIGVAIGTLIAMTYRLIFLAFFLRKNVVNRPIKFFVKNIAIDALAFVLIYLPHLFVNIDIGNYFDWFVYALVCGVIAFLVILTINFLFYRKNTILLFKKILSIFTRKSKSIEGRT